MPKLVVGPDEKDNVMFGEMMAYFRQEARFTRATAADAFGLSPEYIRLIERGKRTPAAASLPKMLNVYGVDAVERVLDRLVVIGDIHVEFTSRITEARGSASERSMPVRTRRSRKIGRIVERLIQADDETLDLVLELLA